MVDSFWRPNMDIFTYSVFLLCPPRSCFSAGVAFRHSLSNCGVVTLEIVFFSIQLRGVSMP